MRYSMIAISDGTRVRWNHGTFAEVITSVNKGAFLTGNDVWEAVADGTEVMTGDKWLYVTHANNQPLPIPGWVALIHKGKPICSDFKEIADNYDDLNVRINIFNNEVTVSVNGKDFTQK